MEKKKHILIIVPSNIGTIALCSLNLYKALQIEQDVSVKCVLVHKLSNGFTEFEHCEWYTRESSFGIRHMLEALSQICWLKRIKNKFKPDITISSLINCSILNVLSGGQDKKIGIFHAPLKQNKLLGTISYSISYLSYKLLFHKLDKAYCVSESVKQDVLKHMWIDKTKVEIVYNIHDINKIREKAEEPINSKYCGLFSKKVILYVGKLYNIKAPDRLLRSYAEIKNLDSQLASSINIVFIGKDVRGTREKLDLIIKKYNISNNVFFVGEQSNPYNFMKKAYIVVSSSKSEGLPGVLIESLLLNTPIVASNSSSGIWEILEDEPKNKIIYNYYASKGIITSNENTTDTLMSIDISNDDKLMANAIITLITNNAIYEKMKTSPFLFENKINSEIAKKYIII